MKVFVQQTETRLFLNDQSEWVPDRETARAFDDAAEAIEFCVAHGLSDVQLLKVSEKGELYGYLQPFGGNDPGLQSSDLDPQARRASEKMLGEKSRQEEAKDGEES